MYPLKRPEESATSREKPPMSPLVLRRSTTGQPTTHGMAYAHPSKVKLPLTGMSAMLTRELDPSKPMEYAVGALFNALPWWYRKLPTSVPFRLPIRSVSVVPLGSSILQKVNALVSSYTAWPYASVGRVPLKRRPRLLLVACATADPVSATAPGATAFNSSPTPVLEPIEVESVHVNAG